jgi:hypothetical protein
MYILLSFSTKRYLSTGFAISKDEFRIFKKCELPIGGNKDYESKKN